MAEIKNNDSISKTLLVVLVLCLVCSIVVAGSAVGLKPLQQEQRALDKQRNILAVAGLMQEGRRRMTSQRCLPNVLPHGWWI